MMTMPTEKQLRRPAWLDKKINFSGCEHVHRLFNDLSLNTVCHQARCPNIGECFASGVATVLILGRVCTRGCGFCAVEKGAPQALDQDEPRRVAEAVKKLKLRHVVITSVTRDDLPQGGAGHFAAVIDSIRQCDPSISVEVLVPDFQADAQAIKMVIAAKPAIFAHNVETVHRLYAAVRSGADYARSLRVLEMAKCYDAQVLTKSGIMLGLGERQEEVLRVLVDLRQVRCDFLSIGQYLAPGKAHVPVKRFVSPEEFLFYKQQAEQAGFRHVESGPYVRSSYLASAYIAKHPAD